MNSSDAKGGGQAGWLAGSNEDPINVENWFFEIALIHEVLILYQSPQELN